MLAGALFLSDTVTCLAAGTQFSTAFANNESVSMDEFVRAFKLLYQHPSRSVERPAIRAYT